MEFRYGMLADYAGIGQNNKLILVGIFDGINHQPNPATVIVAPPFYLVGVFDAPTWEGSDHKITWRFQDEDGNDHTPPGLPELPMRFVPQGPGRPMRGHYVCAFQQFVLPHVGDFDFHFYVDGNPIGIVPFFVREAPAQP